MTAYTPILRHPPSLLLLALSAVRGIWWIGLVTYLGAFLATTLALSATAIGLIYALAGVAFALGSVLAGRGLGEAAPRTVIAAASLVGALLMAPLLRAPSLALVLVVLPALALCAAIWGVAAITGLAKESVAGAGTTMVLNGSLLNLGAAGGAMLGGALIALGGFAALGIGLPCVALGAAVLAWWPARRQVKAVRLRHDER